MEYCHRCRTVRNVVAFTSLGTEIDAEGTPKEVLTTVYDCEVCGSTLHSEWIEVNWESDPLDPQAVASFINAEIGALPIHDAPSVRPLRRKYSRRLKRADATVVLDLARALIEEHGHRWVAYELIRHHQGAFESLNADKLEELGRGINSWGTVDAFARTLAGPAWVAGQVPDQVFHRWARSPDRWWRRAALVSTVALNVKASGGSGDAPRTLEVCRVLVDDPEDMVVKAMSWALRALVPHDPEAVRTFLAQHEEALAARVKREVRNKLATGLKNPSRKGVAG